MNSLLKRNKTSKNNELLNKAKITQRIKNYNKDRKILRYFQIDFFIKPKNFKNNYVHFHITIYIVLN